MQSKSKSASRMEVNAYNTSSPATCSEPWRRSMDYNSIPATEIGGNTSNSSLLEQSKDCQSQSDDGRDEEDDDAIKESQITASPHSDGNYGQDNQNFQHQTSVIPRTSNENLTQPPQFELVGHSIACTSNPYQDPYYGGMMAGYGPQPLVPHLLDVHYARLPLALEMAQEPVYVNAKQYRGILRRRQSRAKAELEKKLIKARKPYLHESRHQHAKRRARGSGGRFAKKSNTLKCTTKEMGTASVSAGSSGSEPLHNKATEIQNSHQEGKGPEVHKMFEARGYTDRSEGDSSDHQWGSVLSNKASQRALAT